MVGSKVKGQRSKVKGQRRRCKQGTEVQLLLQELEGGQGGGKTEGGEGSGEVSCVTRLCVRLFLWRVYVSAFW
eukprot:467517-Rhodomonas_salina.2